MTTITKHPCVFISDEPGDGTRYQWVVTGGGTNPADDAAYITVTPVYAKRYGYPLLRDEVENAVSCYPGLVKYRSDYKLVAHKLMADGSDGDPQVVAFVRYVQEHIDLNPWTALAAIRAAYFAMREGL